MVTNPSRTPNLYALLIGINYYLPKQLPGGGKYKSLGGCLGDITLVEEFLKTRLQVPENCIFKLTSSRRGANKPSEPPDRLPTYENMVLAFQNLTDIAQPGDQVYIHYSGHGGRTSPTKLPKLKGPNAKDESLVPFNIGLPEARYLRDVELAYLIQRMVDKKLIVTVVLDSCHSGGATRGDGDAIARGTDEVDSTPRPMESLVATEEELAQTWRSLSSIFTGDPKQGIGWLPEPQGYTLMAACRPHEVAYEKRFEENSGFNGALTYYLVKALRKMEPNLTTYHLIYNSILPGVRSHFKGQTPLLQGEGSRVVFGSSRLEPVYAVNVMQVDQKNQRVLLDTGKAQAVRTDAEFAIYPSSAIDFTQVSQRLALVRIAELGATSSWAAIAKTFGSKAIEIGDRAVLLDPGSMRLRSNVCLVRDHETQLTRDREDALERVRQALEQGGKGFAVLSVSDQSIHYQVAINAERAYEIWDAAGNLIELRPQILIDADNAAMRLVQRLVHLTKYHNIQRLENYNSLSPLKGKLQVKLLKAQSDYERDDKPEPQSFQNPDEPTIQVGEWMFIHVKNDSPQTLNVAILGLQSDWGIKHLYPNSDMNFLPFEPGDEYYFPLCPKLPDGYAEGTDILKVFATIGPTQFRWLALPALDEPPDPGNVEFRQKRGPETSLEEFLAAMTADNLEVEELDPREFDVNSVSLEWVTEQRQIRIEKG